VVVGSYVYEGKALTQLAGSYIFAYWPRSFAKGDISSGINMLMKSV